MWPLGILNDKLPQDKMKLRFSLASFFFFFLKKSSKVKCKLTAALSMNYVRLSKFLSLFMSSLFLMEL